MTKKFFISAALIGSLLLGGCSTPSLQAGGTYDTEHFSFTISEDFIFEDSIVEDNYFVFSAVDGEVLSIGVVEYSGRMTAQAHMEQMMADFEEASGEAFTVNGMEGYRFTAAGSEGTDAYWCVGYAGYAIGINVTNADDAQLAWFESEAEHFMQNLVYIGEEPEGGVFTCEYFTLPYDEKWYIDESDATKLMLCYAAAENDCGNVSGVFIEALPGSALTPEEAAAERQTRMEEMNKYEEITVGTGEIYGRQAWMASGVLYAIQLHSLEYCWYFFEENGILYQICVRTCRDDTSAYPEEVLALEPQWG